MNTAELYSWIKKHPKLQSEIDGYLYHPWIQFEPVPVGEDGRAHIDPEMNTEVEWYVECGIYTVKRGITMEVSDHRLFCQEHTADEAVRNLYELVLKYYGDYND